MIAVVPVSAHTTVGALTTIARSTIARSTLVSMFLQGTVLDEYSIFCQMPEHLREELAVYLGYIVDEDGGRQLPLGAPANFAVTVLPFIGNTRPVDHAIAHGMVELDACCVCVSVVCGVWCKCVCCACAAYRCAVLLCCAVLLYSVPYTTASCRPCHLL